MTRFVVCAIVLAVLPMSMLNPATAQPLGEVPEDEHHLCRDWNDRSSAAGRSRARKGARRIDRLVAKPPH